MVDKHPATLRVILQTVRESCSLEAQPLRQQGQSSSDCALLICRKVQHRRSELLSLKKLKWFGVVVKTTEFTLGHLQEKTS